MRISLLVSGAGLHALQRLDIALVAGIVPCRDPGILKLPDHMARKRVGRRAPHAARWGSSQTAPAELPARASSSPVEEDVRDEGKIGRTGAVQGDSQHVGCSFNDRRRLVADHVAGKMAVLAA